MKIITKNDIRKNYNENILVVHYEDNTVYLIAELEFAEDPIIQEFSNWQLCKSVPVLNAVSDAIDNHAGNIYIQNDFKKEIDAVNCILNYIPECTCLRISKEEKLQDIMALVNEGFYVLLIDD